MSLGDSLNTSGLQQWVTELQAGRPDEAEPVFRQILTRVERMTRHAFRRYARVGKFVEIEDVIQNTMVRLLNAFRQIRPESTRDFYAFTNELIRREFLDLVRRFFGQKGDRPQLASLQIGEGEGELNAPALPLDADLEQMAEFHEAVAKLPTEQREVIGLAYYHGWTQAQIAELLGVTTRTVQRWQEAASAQLRQVIDTE
jgi:RNA polymerase sigma factor (sigma-70 family)